jgi:putative aldouronate transport system substrate-binding protein
MEKPSSLDDLEEYLRNVKENEEGVYPMTWIASTNFKPEHTFLNYMNFGQNNCAVYIHFDEQGNVLPIQPIYEDEKFLNWVDYANRWYQEGLIQKDIMAQKDDKGALFSGKAACGGVEPFEDSSLQANVPGGSFESIYFTGEQGQDAFVTDFKMWNFLCLNSKSKDPVRVTMFYDWIFADQANYDLLNYGIEGKHWIDTGNHTYDTPAGLDASLNYTFPGYVLLDNPVFDRIYEQGSEEYKKDLAFRRDVNNFTASALTGFTPNYDNIQNEMAKVGAIWAETIFALGAGVLDPDEELEGIKEKLIAAGYDKIVEEAKSQVDAYLGSN